MDARGEQLRRVRFWILEKLILPVATLPLRLLVRTWRMQALPAATVERIGHLPRVIVAVQHGHLPASMAWANLWAPYGRRWLGLLTPSLDGRLLAAALKRFGVDSVALPSRTRGVAGAQEFIRCIEAGAIGVIAVDGPRGPRGVVKDGVARTAAAAHAAIIVASTAARPAITLRSWDRACLPLPFARVKAHLHVLPPRSSDEAYTAQEIQAAFASDTADSSGKAAEEGGQHPSRTSG